MSDEIGDSSFSSLTAEQRRLNDASDWDNWAANIEFKLSRTSTIAMGALVGAAAGLALVGLQSTVVIKLMKTQAQVVLAINTMVGSGTEPGPSSSERYSKPSGMVNTEAAPVDPEELDELTRLMNASKNGDLPEFNEQ